MKTQSNNQMAQNGTNIKKEYKTHFDEKNLIITYETFSSFGCIKGNDFKLHSPHFRMQISEIENIKEILDGNTNDRCLYVNGITFGIDGEIDKKNIAFCGKSEHHNNTLYVISNSEKNCIFIVCDDSRKTNDSYDKFIRIGKKFIDDLERMV